MATIYKIHPAIGIARVGNSPSEFFIGPERVGEQPDPSGGFKDGQCRVKRQAARFRIFAHNDDGTVEELTAADADISWTVHVANSKAAFPQRANAEPAADLTIDPGSRTLASQNATAQLDGGTITFAGEAPVEVPLGEIRTDDDGHLLVLGGSGTSASPTGDPIQNFWDSEGWYDDVSDGPVSASVTLHSNGETPSVAGSWVIVGPPKFAPHQDSVTTLYDRLTQKMIDDGELTAPPITSYTRDVYPILKRAEDMAWVEGLTSNHNWTHPVTNQAMVDAIFSRVSDPSSGSADMPSLQGSDSTITPTQYTHLQRWQSGSYANDWAGPPTAEATITPEGMDQAALEACVGGAFYPGIEAGGRSPDERPILLQPYSEAFRLDHTSSGPGDISASMALPWQADFKACGDRWWPVPRPNDVFTTPGGPSLSWDRGVTNMDEMVSEWSTLGFVVRQGSEHLEVERCDTQSINLLTPTLDFIDVSQGPMAGVREVPLAITFEVISPAGAITLEYAPGGGPNHPQLVAIDTSVTVGPTTDESVATARLWLVFRTGAAASAIPTQTLTVREPATGRTWDIEVNGNTVARTTTGLALALDRSGSMNQDRGDGQTKHDSLQEAANMFVDLMLEGDGAGIVRFNGDAQPLTDVLELGNGQLTDTNRTEVHTAMSGTGLNPTGSTSIGDGIHEARNALDAATIGYDRDALLVLTDGIENQSRWVADVAADIDAKTYAIGFGRPENISVAALQTISGNSGGYLQITGPITNDNRYRLHKHFLQTLSGVNNSEVILDPDGHLTAGNVVKIPFVVSEADTGIEVILLTPQPSKVDFRLVSPLGQIIEPWQAQAQPTMHYGVSDQSSFYRVSLPLQVQPGRFDQVGTWYALMRIGEHRIGPSHTRTDPTMLRPGGLARGVNPELAGLETQRRFELAKAHPNGPSSVAGRSNVTGAEADSGDRKGVPYSLVVHAYSNLSMVASVKQKSYEPGSVVELSTSITQSGMPMTEATVWATVTDAAGSESEVEFRRQRGGRWTAEFIAETPGAHQIRLRANGKTRAGERFTRERLLTAQVWAGAGRPDDRASNPAPPGPSEEPGHNGSGGGKECSWCELLACLIGRDGAIDQSLWERLKELGVDVERVWKCVEACGEDSHR